MTIQEANGDPLISEADFKAAITESRNRLKETSITAAYRVLVKGERPADAARDMGVSRQLVHRAAQTVRGLHLSRNAYPPDWVEAKVVAPVDALEKFRETVERLRQKAMKPAKPKI
jgi:hypothetical protein